MRALNFAAVTVALAVMGTASSAAAGGIRIDGDPSTFIYDKTWVDFDPTCDDGCVVGLGFAKQIQTMFSTYADGTVNPVSLSTPAGYVDSIYIYDGYLGFGGPVTGTPGEPGVTGFYLAPGIGLNIVDLQIQFLETGMAFNFATAQSQVLQVLFEDYNAHGIVSIGFRYGYPYPATDRNPPSPLEIAYRLPGRVSGSFLPGSDGYAALLGEGDVYIASYQIGTAPEPSTWSCMILGFGAAGAVMRRRRSALARP